MSVISCNNDESKKFHLEGSDSGIVEISNDGKKFAEFEMKINNIDFNNESNIVNFIKNIDSQNANEGLEMKAFRFVCTYTWHDNLITKHSWAYSPFVAINSLGGQLCGFRSAVLTNLLKLLGFEARSWSLKGHVVTEVNTGEKWIVLDPDLGVYYYNDKNEIAGFEEICKNGELVCNPINPILAKQDFNYITAYSKKVALMYTSTFDNEEFITDYDSSFSKISVKFKLPPESILTMPFNKNPICGSLAYAELEIPDGFVGEIEFPFVIADVVGTGKIKYLNLEYSIDSFSSENIVCGNSNFDTKLEITENLGGVKIYYYINPLVYSFPSGSNVEIKGKHVKDVNLKFSSRKDINLIMPGEEDILFSKIKAVILKYNAQIVSENKNEDKNHFINYFNLLLEELAKDDELRMIVDFNQVKKDYEVFVINLNADSTKNFVYYYNNDVGADALYRFIRNSVISKSEF